MLRFIIFLSFLVFIFSACSNNKGESTVVAVPRDTSITLANAYTHLLLDSLSVEKFINHEVKDKDRAVKIRNFYNSRNYQFAWFDENGLTEQGEAFWSLHQMGPDKLNDSSVYSRQLHKNMQAILDADTATLVNNDFQQIELGLTLHFFTYLNSAFSGKVQPEEMQWHIPRRKIDEQAMLDSFLTSQQKEWKPLHQSFYRLQTKLVQYAAIAKKGGWPVIELKKNKWKKGVSDPVITQVKKRLLLTGDFSLQDTSNLFSDSLQVAVKKQQRAYGLKETGIIDADLIKEWNVPASERVKQMKINLERMRWMPEESGNRLVANIPEYKLHVYEQGRELFHMDIVVGKAANRTVIFSDELQYVVFSPYWNIPRSIVRREILPALKRSSSYLRRNNMEITGRYSDGLPVVRQKPGKGNALGKVKFIFPNRYNIYFHDTPAKTLFSNQKRAFSHGCIRLQQPFELAKYLLRNNEKWPADSITAAMNADTEKWVKLEQPVPVFIVYFTSWVDKEGLLHFREDIYGHDERMAQHLFH